MPRVVSTDEEVEVPVTVFALEDGVGKVDVKIAANESFSPVGPSSKSITLGRSGEEVVSFRLKVNKRTGIGKVRVTAASSGDSSASEIELDVREPNPYVTLSKDYVIDPGKTMAVKPLKENGKAKLELSSIPPIDLSRRLEYLVRYPHGCIEQITSGAFPQLYLPSVVECDANMLQDIDRNVKSVLSRLGSYQLSDGAFAYWSGNTSRSEWGTVYATHFLIEAAKHGYGVDRAMLDRVLKYLRGNPSDYYLTQAYTQYVLALNGTPTRGAMNQLREKAASLSGDAKVAAGGSIRTGRQPEGRRGTDLALRGQRGKGQPLRRHLQQRRTPDVDLAHDAHDTRTPRRGFPHGAEDVGHPQEGQVAQHPVDGMDAQHPFQFRRSGTERHRRHCGQGSSSRPTNPSRACPWPHRPR